MPKAVLHVYIFWGLGKVRPRTPTTLSWTDQGGVISWSSKPLCFLGTPFPLHAATHLASSPRSFKTFSDCIKLRGSGTLVVQLQRGAAFESSYGFDKLPRAWEIHVLQGLSLLQTLPSAKSHSHPSYNKYFSFNFFVGAGVISCYFVENLAEKVQT